VHALDDRILVFPEGKGSTVGSYVIYNLKLEGHSPRALVMLKADAIITMGCIAAGIPLVHMLSRQDFDSLRNGMRVAVNSARGQVRIGGAPG
jgi:predicted aconitase with swiveling domain